MSEGKVQQKQQARRAEIVVAAQKCFAEKGLHGASVADIAREAGLSVGQLYRIFASKEAIIEAIVSEIVNARVGEMIDENHNLARKAAVLAGRIPTSAATKSDNYLLMEINAEASRNPRLREILMQAERGGRSPVAAQPSRAQRCATQCRIRAHRRSDRGGSLPL